MARDDDSYLPVYSDLAWDFLVNELIAIINEKQRFIRAGFSAYEAERAVGIRRIIFRVKCVKVMRAEASRGTRS